MLVKVEGNLLFCRRFDEGPLHAPRHGRFASGAIRVSEMVPVLTVTLSLQVSSGQADRYQRQGDGSGVLRCAHRGPGLQAADGRPGRQVRGEG